MPERTPNEPSKIPEEVLWAMGRDSSQIEPLYLRPGQELVSGMVKREDGTVDYVSDHQYISRLDAVAVGRGRGQAAVVIA